MIQAEALKFALEHWKRRMFNTAGELFWMYSDCWGTTGAWTVVDYYLRLKPSHYFVKRIFEPIHISIKEGDIVEIVAINETYKSQEVEVDKSCYKMFIFRLIPELLPSILKISLNCRWVYKDIEK